MGNLTVGAGKQFGTIAAAVAASHDGDVLQLQPGTYTNDFATITHDITIAGMGGMANLVATVPPPNGKAILTTQASVTLDHLDMSGARVSDMNGAAVRVEGGNLTVTNSRIHGNQDGILGNANGGTITIRASELDHNGAGDGYSHNLYVTAGTLDIAGSYFHDASVGHEIKSRADNTLISGTRIFDHGSTSSYSIDLPNGGHAVLTGNIIEQGPNGQNPNIVAFGEEGNLRPSSSLTMSGNTVLNDMGGRGTLLWDASGSPAAIDGTKVWGLSDSQMASGSGVRVSNTTHLTSEPALDTSSPWAGTATVPGATITGTAAADRLTGTAGNDTISGGGGNDVLIGGKGADVLTGGTGYDQFSLSPGDGADSVTDFRSGADKLLLHGVTASQVTTTAAVHGGVSGVDVHYGSDTVFLAGVSKVWASDYSFV